MNKSTIPASFVPTSSIATCPYEALRSGVGLRFRDAARLAWLVLATAMLAAGCAVSTDATEPTPAKVEPEPATIPVCKSSNTAPGCPAGNSASWAITCDIPTESPAVWCTSPDGSKLSTVWCC
jgi:hypothetical protein